MKAYLRLIKTVLVHKWYVLVAGRRLRAPLWRLLVHDLSKFTPLEFYDYAEQFYGDRQNIMGFLQAWLHHQNTNPHHWQWWVLRQEEAYPGNTEALPMPLSYVREMVADWFAASKAYNGKWPNPNDYTWYKAHRPKMHLHPITERQIARVLHEASQWAWK